MFLWRNKNYPRIITKYISLTCPLFHIYIIHAAVTAWSNPANNGFACFTLLVLGLSHVCIFEKVSLKALVKTIIPQNSRIFTIYWPLLANRDSQMGNFWFCDKSGSSTDLMASNNWSSDLYSSFFPWCLLCGIDHDLYPWFCCISFFLLLFLL